MCIGRRAIPLAAGAQLQVPDPRGAYFWVLLPGGQPPGKLIARPRLLSHPPFTDMTREGLIEQAVTRLAVGDPATARRTLADLLAVYERAQAERRAQAQLLTVEELRARWRRPTVRAVRKHATRLRRLPMGREVLLYVNGPGGVVEYEQKHTLLPED